MSFCGCKGTNKRAKYKRKITFSFYFRARVPSMNFIKVSINQKKNQKKPPKSLVFYPKNITFAPILRR